MDESRKLCQVSLVVKYIKVQNPKGRRPIYMKNPFSEVAYCDVIITRQMTSWLTLSGDIQQKLTFKENSASG